MEGRCRDCHYEKKDMDAMPCCDCSVRYVSRFIPKIPDVPSIEKINKIIDKLDQMTIGMNVWPSEIVKMLEDLRERMLT